MSSDVILQFIADWLVVPIVLAAGLAILFTPKKDRYQNVARAIVAGMVALLVANIMSALYSPERPFIATGETPKASYLPDSSFPSDHTLLVFTATFVVWAVTKNKWLTGVLLVGSVAVGVGRVLALVHTPLDIAGGIVAALIAVVCLYGRTFFTSRQ